MRKLLNTLYVTSPDAYLTRDGLNVVVKVNDEERFRVPIINIEDIVCFSYVGASPAFLRLCFENNKSVSFLNEHGFFQGQLNAFVNGNVLLRRKQYRLADDTDFRLQISKRFIGAKIFNQRNVILRVVRDNPEIVPLESIENAAHILALALQRIEDTPSIEMLRGIEGEAANAYFSVFDHLILQQKENFSFNNRNRRPPTDKVNALLSFTYTMLAHQCKSALQAIGLDPYVGFLHTDRPGRMSLALDMMEELRPYFGDRLVLSMINKRQIKSSSFKEGDLENAVWLNDEGKKIVIETIQKRKQEEIQHDFLGEKIPLGLLPFAQALLLSRYLRGDLDDYPPFYMK
ncbi:MAG TPA: type I-C CRISPR-associated endonuclease Cas1c [Salinivirgaceae bacterium]|nr:type I-C CRISPR-associated endonuclease Cas1c [Salinivirgaceae bacterium]